jgi:hypothetical protein
MMDIQYLLTATRSAGKSLGPHAPVGALRTAPVRRGLIASNKDLVPREGRMRMCDKPQSSALEHRQSWPNPSRS